MGAIRAVLFDAVGTLIRPQPPVASVYHGAAERYGSRLNPTEIAQRFRQALQHFAYGGLPEAEAVAHVPAPQRYLTSQQQERQRWRQIVAWVLDDVQRGQDDLFEELWNHFADPSHWQVFPDVAQNWQLLKSRGYQLGIASNLDNRLVNVCRHLAPLNQTQQVFFSAAIGASKPHALFFRAVEQQLGLGPQQLLLVGDDPTNDYQGAQAAGWQALLLDRSAQHPAAPHIIHSLDELPPRL